MHPRIDRSGAAKAGRAQQESVELDAWRRLRRSTVHAHAEPHELRFQLTDARRRGLLANRIALASRQLFGFSELVPRARAATQLLEAVGEIEQRAKSGVELLTRLKLLEPSY